MDRPAANHKNPHAHVIVPPGRRLMHGIKLKFVWKKVSGQGSRGVNANLNLVSFIDFLVVTVIFLLMSFSASGEITVDEHVKLPKAENVEDMVDAPIVAINGVQILVNGKLAGSTRSVDEVGKMQKIDELFDILKKMRGQWKKNDPRKPFPGVVILQVDKEVSALVVKSVFQTAAFAGYPNVSFMVQKLPKGE